MAVVKARTSWKIWFRLGYIELVKCGSIWRLNTENNSEHESKRAIRVEIWRQFPSNDVYKDSSQILTIISSDCSSECVPFIRFFFQGENLEH